MAFGVGLRVTLYFGEGYTPPVREKLLECIAEYLEQTAPNLAWARLSDRPRKQPFRLGIVAKLRSWVMRASANTRWEFAANSSADESAASPFQLHVLVAGEWEYRVRETLSYISATFPASRFAGKDERLPALLYRWADRLSPRHGFGGLSLHLPENRPEVARWERMLYELARHFPGLELDYPATQLHALSTRLKGADWLTVVGDALLAELGRRAALETRLPAGATVLPYAGGIVVQLGPAPQLGGAMAGNVPVSYAALSQLLRPVRVDPPTGFGVSQESGYDREGTRALLARFDGTVTA